MFFAFHIRFEEKLRNLSFSMWREKKNRLFFGFAKRKLLLKSWVWKTRKENFLKEFYHQPANFSTVVIQNKCFLYPMPIFATPFTIKTPSLLCTSAPPSKSFELNFHIPSSYLFDAPHFLKNEACLKKNLHYISKTSWFQYLENYKYLKYHQSLLFFIS